MIERDQTLEAMDDKCRLELLPVDLQLTVLGKMGWKEFATLACASKHFRGLVRYCGCLSGLDLASHNPPYQNKSRCKVLDNSWCYQWSCRAGAGDKRAANLEHRAYPGVARLRR